MRPRGCTAVSRTDWCSPGPAEQAAGGTLFINGLEDLPPGAQRVLLADLEEGHWRREGGTATAALAARCLASVQPGHEGLATAACGATCSRIWTS